MAEKIEHYPIALLEDRYGGVYSGGAWLAIAKADEMENGCYRIVRVLEYGPHGDDCEAMMFWDHPPRWIASGNTPDDAKSKLFARMTETPLVQETT